MGESYKDKDNNHIFRVITIWTSGSFQEQGRYKCQLDAEARLAEIKNDKRRNGTTFMQHVQWVNVDPVFNFNL